MWSDRDGVEGVGVWSDRDGVEGVDVWRGWGGRGRRVEEVGWKE